MSGRHR
ncbi:hypothetical protein Tco_0420303, partial [Tanacetum coccineum]